jgi:hypothetical protein
MLLAMGRSEPLYFTPKSTVAPGGGSAADPASMKKEVGRVEEVVEMAEEVELGRDVDVVEVKTDIDVEEDGVDVVMAPDTDVEVVTHVVLVPVSEGGVVVVTPQENMTLVTAKVPPLLEEHEIDVGPDGGVQGSKEFVGML